MECEKVRVNGKNFITHFPIDNSMTRIHAHATKHCVGTENNKTNCLSELPLFISKRERGDWNDRETERKTKTAQNRMIYTAGKQKHKT